MNLPLTKEDIKILQNDLNGMLTTPGYVVKVDLNCTDEGDTIVIDLIHSTGLSIGQGEFEILDTDTVDTVFDACDETLLEILDEARSNFRPSALRRIMALYDLDVLLESFSLNRSHEVPWGIDSVEVTND